MTQSVAGINSNDMTSIPNVFIDEHMLLARPDFIKVYLFGIRNMSENPGIKKTAEILSIREVDVVNAWTYWENAGLVHITGGSIEDFEVEYIYPSSSLEASKELDNPAQKNTDDAPVELETRPSYTVDEISLATEKNNDVKYLFKMAEKIFGKPLTYNEMNLLLSFHDWLMLPVEVIEVLLDYCVSNNHKNGRYLEKVAINWADSKITTVEEAELYIKTFNGDYRAIMTAFGLNRRDPSPKEIVYMKRWLEELSMPLDVVIEACGRTILQISQPKFSYTDTILDKWHKNEVKTLEEALKFEEEFKNSKKNSPKKTASKQKSKFVNYKGREWDYDKLEKLAQEYAENSLKPTL